jgi:DNA ligase D-like protein (predicted 3'-phosphoesterase)
MHTKQCSTESNCGYGNLFRIELETSRAGRQDKKHTRPSGEATQRICREARLRPNPGAPRFGFRGEGREFVVQKHAARRLHYDLRLEMDGVLKSWAVTKGPSLTPGEKRLAVRTEDHPIEYLDFEGNIPKGEYGAGSMIVWDRGRWEPDGDPQKGLTKGHLAFTLDGARLKGRWHLVRMRPRSGEKTEPWLLIKSDDEFGRHIGDREITDEEATSHISGRTNEELAATGEIRKDHAARGRLAKARKASLPNIRSVRAHRVCHRLSRCFKYDFSESFCWHFGPRAVRCDALASYQTSMKAMRACSCSPPSRSPGSAGRRCKEKRVYSISRGPLCRLDHLCLRRLLGRATPTGMFSKPPSTTPRGRLRWRCRRYMRPLRIDVGMSLNR